MQARAAALALPTQTGAAAAAMVLATAAAVEALVMVRAMVLEITAVQRRKKPKSIFPLQALLLRNRPAKGPKHYEPGDIVEHKVFGRGQVVAVKPAAGDQIVEINF